MTITQPLALTAAYMNSQFTNDGQTQTVNVYWHLANPTTDMTSSQDAAADKAEEVCTVPGGNMTPNTYMPNGQAATGVTKRTNKYIVGAVPTAGTVSAKVACCAPNQEFLRDFYDSASIYNGPVIPSGLIP